MRPPRREERRTDCENQAAGGPVGRGAARAAALLALHQVPGHLLQPRVPGPAVREQGRHLRRPHHLVPVPPGPGPPARHDQEVPLAPAPHGGARRGGPVGGASGVQRVRGAGVPVQAGAGAGPDAGGRPGHAGPAEREDDGPPAAEHPPTGRVHPRGREEGAGAGGHPAGQQRADPEAAAGPREPPRERRAGPHPPAAGPAGERRPGRGRRSGRRTDGPNDGD